MPETKAEMCSGNLETALFELIRNGVQTEVQEISKLRSDQDRLLTIDQVAQTLSVSKDWIYRNEKDSHLQENSDQKWFVFLKPICRNG
jgi:hypothetical protein